MNSLDAAIEMVNSLDEVIEHDECTLDCCTPAGGAASKGGCQVGTKIALES